MDSGDEDKDDDVLATVLICLASGAHLTHQHFAVLATANRAFRKAVARAKPFVTNVTLRLNQTQDLPYVIDAIATCKVIDARYSGLGAGGMRVLAKAATSQEAFEHLTSLNISTNVIGDDGLRAIANAVQAGAFRNLSKLTMRENQISADGGRAIAQVARWERLTELDVAENNLGDEGARVFAKAAKAGAFPKLRYMNLSSNNVTSRGVKALADESKRGAFALDY